MPTARLDSTTPRRSTANRDRAASPTTPTSSTHRTWLPVRTRRSWRGCRTLRALVSSPHRSGTRSAVRKGRARPQGPTFVGISAATALTTRTETGPASSSPSRTMLPRTCTSPAPRADASASAERRRARSVCTASAKTATSTAPSPERARASSAYVEAIRSLVCSNHVGEPGPEVEGTSRRQLERRAPQPASLREQRVGVRVGHQLRIEREPRGQRSVAHQRVEGAARAGVDEDRPGDRGPDARLLVHRRGHQVGGVRLVPAVGVDDVDDRRHHQRCRVWGRRSLTWRSRRSASGRGTATPIGPCPS